MIKNEKFNRLLPQDNLSKKFDPQTLSYRKPYRWDLLITFLSMRAIPGVEKVQDNQYYRNVQLVTDQNIHTWGWIHVRNNEEMSRLEIDISDSLQTHLPLILAKISNLFDLDCDPEKITNDLICMKEIEEDLFVPGIRIPGCFDPFEMSVRAILGQQISVKAATTLSGRMAATFGMHYDSGIEGLTTTFPSAEDILLLEGSIEDHLGSIGIIAARARTIRALATVITEDKIEFESTEEPEKEIEKLIELPGIGPWTANYIAMRALQWTDGFPASDLGIKRVLEPRTVKEILALAEQWRPWRAYAAMSIWNKY
ncbi:MAG: DNA-3-methyladenine glycosylase family protein [Lachnospiraceae bacterium]